MLRTKGFNAYAVEFSPYIQHRLAVATSANFGIVGNGRLWIVDNSNLIKVCYDTQDGLFDCAWNESNENQIVVSSGDGSIKLFDLNLPDFPIRNWSEHTKEVFSVNWNMIRKDIFCSSSWDHLVKWDPNSPKSLLTLQGHTQCVYNAVWSPYNVDSIATASGDHTAKIWDSRSPPMQSNTHTLVGHTNEVLGVDWNKYKSNLVVSGSVDRTCKIWDLRNPQKELLSFVGHEFAVRRVKFSPHSENVFSSCSYDMTMKLWDIVKGGPVFEFDRHTEFVLGMDFSLFNPRLLATCSWDETVQFITL